jgi:Carboxypeptidase regulatory-like domain
MKSTVVTVILFLGLSSAMNAAAQIGDGSLRGTVKDEQAALMPGVTISATSPALLAPSVTVTDSTGSYRLINLPPGTYTLEAELVGFKSFRQEGILLRAGANFQVDVTLTVGALEETITVVGESPMLEITNPGNVLTVDAEFQRPSSRESTGPTSSC